MKTSELELENMIQGFILSYQTEGKSPNTITWYRDFINRFMQFLKSRDYPTIIASINQNHIRTFIWYLQTEARTPYKERLLSQATVQGYVRTLKAFYSWALREEYIANNPMVKIPVPRAINKLIETFTLEQITRLIAVCQQANGIGYRNLAIILLILDCGLRVSELVNIKLEDLNLTEGQIRLRVTKGNRERMVPIGCLMQKVLWKYVNQYRPQPLTGKVSGLFLNDNGLPLRKSGVQQMLRRYGSRAGISGVRCSPHTLRHTFAKNYLMNGGDIFSLQKILGHSSLASVRKYLNLFAMDIKKHQRFSPVDNLAEIKNFSPLIRSSIRHNHNN